MKRILAFAYGVFCYCIFFGTFLYAVGFVGNIFVPKSIDSAPRVPFMTALLINAFLLIVFALQHSVMARPAFKKVWTRLVPRPVERSTYTLFSSLALILLFWKWEPMGGTVWTLEDSTGRALLHAGFGFGWLLVLSSTFLIDHFDLFGLRQVYLYLVGREYTALKFRTPGPYRMVRHPLYAGWLLAFWCTPQMSFAHLVFSIATSAYILVAIQLEEHDLIGEHGETYARYRDRVPMLIPFLRRRSGATRTIEA